MRNKQSRKINRKINKPKTLKKNQKGGFFSWLIGASKLRGMRYEHWLEERLVLYHNDSEYLKEVRNIFNFQNTNMAGESGFINGLQNRFNNRKSQDKAIIMKQHIQTNNNQLL